MEGLRVVGDPKVLAEKYAEYADEILYQDVVASLYGRPFIPEFLERCTRGIFVPTLVGGGVRTLDDLRALLRSGADSVALNTAAIKRPALINELSDCVGSQAVTVSIEAKRTEKGWEAYTDSGREKTGRDAIQWAHEAVERGAGQILLHSIDRDGTGKGMDLDLYKALGVMPVPVVLGGGVGTVEHVLGAVGAGVLAIAIGAALHYGKISFEEIAKELTKRGLAGGRSAEYGKRTRILAASN